MSDSPAGFTPSAPLPADIHEIGVGLMGYRFMGRAHSNAYLRMPKFFWPPVARPRMVAMCGRTESEVAEAAQRWGWEGYYTDYRRLLDDPRIQLFDNSSGVDGHVQPTLDAIASGKHVLCEKPLAADAQDAYRMWQAAEQAGVVAMTGHNYRFVPAVRFVRELVDEGRLGQIVSFRGRYLQAGWHTADRAWAPRYQRETGGFGALGDIGTHIIDLAHFLVGEIISVSAMQGTLVPELPRTDRPGEMGPVTVDDRMVATVQFAGQAGKQGPLGTLEASKVATGRLNQNAFEINGTQGSVSFDLERLNEVQLYLADEPGGRTEGFRTVSVTERSHTFCGNWWPHGHILGWEHAFVHEVEHLLRCIVEGKPVGPWGCAFEDGFKALAVGEAMEKSAKTGQQTAVDYRR